jgi:hypothetical protein
MGFGLGSAIFIPILTPVIKSSADGYKSAFIGMGIAMIVVIVAVASRRSRSAQPPPAPPRRPSPGFPTA